MDCASHVEACGASCGDMRRAARRTVDRACSMSAGPMITLSSSMSARCLSGCCPGDRSPYENGRPHAPDRSRHIALKKPCHLPLKVSRLDHLLTDDSRGLRPQPDTSGLGDAITGQTVAYQRVSSLDQRADRQLDGITVQRTFTDTVSGKDTDRPQLEAMLGFVRGCDTVIVY